MSSSAVTPTDSGNQASNASSVSTEVPPAPSSGSGGGSISSLASLKVEAPEVYHAMTLSIAQTICNDSKESNDRMIELMKDGEDKDP